MLLDRSRVDAGGRMTMRAAIRRFMLSVALLCLGPATGPVRADIITTLFSTGVDNTGAVIPTGTLDPHYTYGPGLRPFAQGGNGFGWIPNTSASKWVNSAPGGFPPPLPTPVVRIFNYTTTFDLSGLDPTTARITGDVAADDSVTILLNGIPKYSNPYNGFNDPWASFASFMIDTGFIPGVNTLTFAVTHADGPEGLQARVVGTANVATVPEPSTLVLISIGGLIGLGTAWRRKRAAA
jgi:hypothetical protein